MCKMKYSVRARDNHHLFSKRARLRRSLKAVQAQDKHRDKVCDQLYMIVMLLLVAFVWFKTCQYYWFLYLR